MFFYELFHDTQGDNIPELPVYNISVDNFRLSDVGASWQDVCAIMLTKYPFRTVSARFRPSASTNIDLMIKNAVHAVSIMHREEYGAIALAHTAEYNPISNYDMTETGSDIRTGGDHLTHSQTSDTTDSTTVSAATDKNNTPEMTTTTVDAATQDTTSSVPTGQTTTEKNKVNAFDNATLRQDRENEIAVSEQARSQTDAIGERRNTQTTAAVEITTSYGERTSNSTHRDGTTTDTRVYDNDTTTHTLSRSGNIGVTTTQQMLEQERTLRAASELVTRIADDIVTEICIANYFYYGEHICEWGDDI